MSKIKSVLFLGLIFTFSVPAFAGSKSKGLCGLLLPRDTATSAELKAAEEAFKHATRLRDLSEVPEAFRPPFVHQTEFLINGTLETVAEGTKFSEVFSPVLIRDDSEVSGSVPVALGSAPMLDRATGYRALQSAQKAWHHGAGEWPQMSIEVRCRRLEVLAGEMKKISGALTMWIMWEIGKPYPVAKDEVERTIKYIEDTALAARELDKKSRETISQSGDTYSTSRAPYGVSLLFAPYNYPLNETFTSLIPALAMGNTVVLKPAKYGILLMKPLLRLFKKIFPPGVVNVIYGDGKEVFEEIFAKGGFDIFAFIGWEKTAAMLMKKFPKPHTVHSVLGLGAKNLIVVCNGADVEKTVDALVAAGFGYSGQRCTAGKMVMMEEEIAPKIIAALSKKVDALKIGAPHENGVSITASPDPFWAPKMWRLTEDAVSKGARIANVGGGKIANGFYSPTLLVGVTPEMDIYNEEQFGTVLPLMIFKDLSEPIAWQRQSPFGQQISVFGATKQQQDELIAQLGNRVARVNFDSVPKRGPDWVSFGARGESGMGTLGLTDALLEFSTKSVVVRRED